ncbi:MAG: hypothetical protein KF715_14805 [Candidatus Didemnitutus sp.]|nr:hypothetical protein [Candidatus Didemnitutus sp.]
MRIPLLAATAFLATLTASAQVSSYLVEKRTYTEQTQQDTAPTLKGVYEARFAVFGSNLAGLTPVRITTLPVGSLAAAPVNASYTNPNWETIYSTNSKATLDQQFANGAYALQVGGATPSINLGAGGSFTDKYPDVLPLLTGGTWSGGALLIDPTLTSYTFNFNGDQVAAYTSGGRISVTLMSPTAQHAESIYSTTFGVTQSALNSYTINPTLTGMIGGQTYTLELEYSLYTGQGLVGGTVPKAGAFTYISQIQVTAVPEPSTCAVAAGFIALLGAIVWRKRRALGAC